MELYRGFEITPDQAGYGYIATPPEYDIGMPVLHGWTVAEVKTEIEAFLDEMLEYSRHGAD